MAIEFVLDASAILAFLNREAGFEKIEKLLDRSTVTAVNLLEVLTKLVGRGAIPKAAAAVVAALQLPVIAFDEQLALAGADLCHLAGTHGLSTCDRACLAAARERGLTVFHR